MIIICLKSISVAYLIHSLPYLQIYKYLLRLTFGKYVCVCYIIIFFFVFTNALQRMPVLHLTENRKHFMRSHKHPFFPNYCFTCQHRMHVCMS